MDHMGFLKHLRKYKAEIGSLKVRLAAAEKDIEKFIESVGIKDSHIKRLKQSSLDYQRAFEYMDNQNKLLLYQLENYEKFKTKKTVVLKGDEIPKAVYDLVDEFKRHPGILPVEDQMDMLSNPVLIKKPPYDDLDD